MTEGFKETEIGVIPEDWELKIVKDITNKVCVGFVGSCLKYYCDESEGIPMIRTTNLTHNKISYNNLKYVSSEFHKKNKKSQLKRGDLVIARHGDNGQICSFEEDIEANCLNIVVVKPNNKKTYYKYLLYAFKSPLIRHQIDASIVGSVQGVLNTKTIEKLQIPCPNLTEQRKIVYILEKIDQKINLNKDMNQTLEAIGQAIFKHWFVDFEFTDETGNPYKSSGGEMVDSELGEIPREWKVLKLRDLISNYIGGGWGSENQNKDFKIEAFVIRGTDIPKLNNGNISSCPKRYHKESNFKSRKIKPNDIVFEISGGSKGQPVGRSILIDEKLIKNFKNVICASFCKLIRPNSEIISPYFLDYYFKSIYKSGEVNEYQLQSTGITNFNFEYFLDKSVVIPDMSLNNLFHEMLTPILMKKSKLNYQNYILSKIRDSLLPKLMSGKIRVNIPEEVASK